MRPDDPMDSIRTDPELAVLAADLEAVRPTPHPAFLLDLERRLADGFPAPARPRRAPRAWRRFLLPAAATALTAAVVAVVVVVADGGSSDESASVASRPSIARDEGAATGSSGSSSSSS